MQLAVTTSDGNTRTIAPLPDGDAGVTATIAAMQAVIDDALSSEAPALRRVLMDLSSHPIARALWRWCRQHVRFEADPRGVELLRHPGQLLREIEQRGHAAADCDDLAMLGCCLIHAAGFRPVLVTVGRRERALAGRFEHVFFGIQIGPTLTVQHVYPLDPQENTPAGVWPYQARRVKLWAMKPGDQR